MPIKLEAATVEDVAEIASLRTAVARDLTARYGKGHWSSTVSERGVLFDLKRSRVFVARRGGRPVATLCLSTRKPWAIDRTCFTACGRPLYLTSMAVDPDLQGRGIGRSCVDEVRKVGTEWPADGIRLDAYDAEAGAAGFYRKCGFREVGRAAYRKVPLVDLEMLW
jgi:ribosomal protein S18 acetylase RimI-like enzyme